MPGQHWAVGVGGMGTRWVWLQGDPVLRVEAPATL